MFINETDTKALAKEEDYKIPGFTLEPCPYKCDLMFFTIFGKKAIKSWAKNLPI